MNFDFLDLQRLGRSTPSFGPFIALLLMGAACPLACTAGDAPPTDRGGGMPGSGGGNTDVEVPLGGQGQETDLDVIKEQPPTDACGDGMLQEDEACDDGNLESGDGCGSNCRYVEEGFVCAEAGSACQPFAQCGDGKVIFPEQCDDGNEEDGDGCSDICKFEVGYTCSGEPSECTATVCGDGNQEGAETCEAADGMPFDGCSLTCQAEPTCTGNGCTSTCGDGLVIAPEECDDGNAVGGDGCSADCKEEPGYNCRQEPPCQGENCTLELPIIYRDFNGSHSDFYPADDQTCDGLNAGLAAETLDENGKPTLAGSSPCVSSASSFAQWYGAEEGEYATIVESITLYPNGEGGYVNRYGENGEPWSKIATEEQTASNRCEEAGCCDGEDPWNCCEANETTCLPCTYDETAGCAQTFEELDGNPLFFPLDEHPEALPGERHAAKIPSEVYGAVGWPWENPDCEEGASECPGPPHNFHFTSEIAYWFKYEEGTTANLTFIGDDDVWVFLNRRLVLDLGGIHVPLAGSVTLEESGDVTLSTWQPGDANAPTAEVQEPESEQLSLTTTTAAELGMEPGGVYEIKVFHAERKPEGSSYQLTLSGFNSARSECTAVCGDGILAAGEQCDNGDENNTGGHNSCNSECTLGTFCGDGVVQKDAGEECDDNDPDAPSNCAGCRLIVVK